MARVVENDKKCAVWSSNKEMNKFQRRQEGIKKVNRMIRANPSSFWINLPINFGKFIHTRTVCSCYACGNRRKSEGATRQERKAVLDPIAREWDTPEEDKAWEYLKDTPSLGDV